MTVAAGDHHPGADQSLFRKDDVLDALAAVEQADQFDPEVATVALDVVDLRSGLRIGDRTHAQGRGRVDVIDDRERARWPADRTLRLAQRGERLGARVLVQDVAIDVQEQMPIIEPAHRVGVDDLVVERAGGVWARIHQRIIRRAQKAGEAAYAAF